MKFFGYNHIIKNGKGEVFNDKRRYICPNCKFNKRLIYNELVDIYECKDCQKRISKINPAESNK